MIRLYTDGSGGLRFAGTSPELERLAAREIRERRRALEERLFTENMALLGEVVATRRARCELLHLVPDRSEETL